MKKLILITLLVLPMVAVGESVALTCLKQDSAYEFPDYFWVQFERNTDTSLTDFIVSNSNEAFSDVEKRNPPIRYNELKIDFSFTNKTLGVVTSTLDRTDGTLLVRSVKNYGRTRSSAKYKCEMMSLEKMRIHRKVFFKKIQEAQLF